MAIGSCLSWRGGCSVCADLPTLPTYVLIGTVGRIVGYIGLPALSQPLAVTHDDIRGIPTHDETVAVTLGGKTVASVASHRAPF
jgi:hypothetical protein